MDSFEIFYFDPLRNILRDALPYPKQFWLDIDGNLSHEFLRICHMFYDYDIEHRGYYCIRVRNGIHECRYTLGDFLSRIDDGQRRFIKQNHPTFRRWRPMKKREGGAE